MIELLHFKNRKVNGSGNYNISRIGTSHFAITVSNLNSVYKNDGFISILLLFTMFPWISCTLHTFAS